jgi:hypothetical protein
MVLGLLLLPRIQRARVQIWVRKEFILTKVLLVFLSPSR